MRLALLVHGHLERTFHTPDVPEVGYYTSAWVLWSLTFSFVWKEFSKSTVFCSRHLKVRFVYTDYIAVRRIVSLKCINCGFLVSNCNTNGILPYCYSLTIPHSIRHSWCIVSYSEAGLCVPYFFLPLFFFYSYRGADKSLARPGRKQTNVSVRMA
jgi:hypothetical protein